MIVLDSNKSSYFTGTVFFIVSEHIVSNTNLVLVFHSRTWVKSLTHARQMVYCWRVFLNQACIMVYRTLTMTSCWDFYFKRKFESETLGTGACEYPSDGIPPMLVKSKNLSYSFLFEWQTHCALVLHSHVPKTYANSDVSMQCSLRQCLGSIYGFLT